jgi:hypothetical protein
MQLPSGRGPVLDSLESCRLGFRSSPGGCDQQRITSPSALKRVTHTPAAQHTLAGARRSKCSSLEAPDARITLVQRAMREKVQADPRDCVALSVLVHSSISCPTAQALVSSQRGHISKANLWTCTSLALYTAMAYADSWSPERSCLAQPLILASCHRPIDQASENDRASSQTEGRRLPLCRSSPSAA